MRARWLTAVLFLGAAPASAAPANTLKEMFAELGQCVGRPPMAAGAEVTLLFSLNRRGGLIGKPRLTYAKFPADPQARAETATAVAAALDRCLPLAITDALGGAIAGRPMTLRLTASSPDTGA